MSKIMPQVEWWKEGPIYELYIRSFYDGNNDGIGEIKGIIEKLPYLKWLGVKGVWITPFFISGMIDYGYDIIDHCEIDPIFGTMGDFKLLIKQMHNLEMKIVIDIVANHTSDQCKWFKASVNRKEPFSDYYIWRDAKIDPNGQKTLPTNWISRFGGPAWSWHPVRQQYYMHTFHPQQPNLNCRNPKVMQELLNILKFWIDLGVDGFRFDAVKHMICDKEFRDNVMDELFYSYTGKMHCISSNFRFDYDQHEVFQVIRQMTDFVKEQAGQQNRHILTITEAYTSPELTQKYHVEAGADMPFNFALTCWNSSTSSAPILKNMIQEALNTCKKSGAWPNWVLGNHDRSRIGTRLGAEKHPELMDLANMLLLLLPGTPICYYGDELGMLDVAISYENCLDEVGKKLGPEAYKQRSRDPCRAPMPWTDETPNGGFTTAGKKPWLLLPENLDKLSIKCQKIDQESHLNFFQNLVEFRHNSVILRQFGENIDFPVFHTSDQQQQNQILVFTRYAPPSKQQMSHYYLIILHLGYSSNQINDEFTYLTVTTNDKTANNGIKYTAKLVFKTPNVKNLKIGDLVSLENVPIGQFQGLLFELNVEDV